MEHEVYIPYSAADVRAALADPARALTRVPGFHPDPDSAPGAPGGRLRVRVGGSTITYRGTLVAVERGEGFIVTAEGVEARGDGEVRLTLEVVPRPAADDTGTTLVFSGTVRAGGRLADIEPGQRESAARRLLDRFAEALVASPTDGGDGAGADVPRTGEDGAGSDGAGTDTATDAAAAADAGRPPAASGGSPAAGGSEEARPGTPAAGGPRGTSEGSDGEGDGHEG
ncbi:SRPBCC family protein, partial [Streptomyces alkaliphilus]|uniref:SRPBCC family protein n=1 Tax=Streptomyces alkaliphilus TaxID=1472722 RepID=UPI001191DACD|nr:carbon monoxide dehydrogenase [Streptomyces alkaliphilus]